jgi:RNA polymerase sigma-70 factor (ECF subfamily)
LYAKSGGEKFGLSYSEFAATLRETSAKYLTPDASLSETMTFYQSLRLEDLSLARACAKGCEPAWEYFLHHYRPKLYSSALMISREESVARELADSLHSELFGLRVDAEGRRISKLEFYTGRGSLEGWLRAVLAQSYVNRNRSHSHLEPLDENAQPIQAPETDKAAPDPRLARAVCAAWQAITTEQRLILSCYYCDQQSLAQLGRLLRVHESTVFRRLRGITKRVRRGVIQELRSLGMSKREAEEALQTDVRDVAVNLGPPLTQKE